MSPFFPIRSIAWISHVAWFVVGILLSPLYLLHPLLTQILPAVHFSISPVAIEQGIEKWQMNDDPTLYQSSLFTRMDERYRWMSH
jgi:hypothetical protein